MDQVGTPFNEMHISWLRTDGDFGYRLWDPENRKLIRNSDVVFNDDSILSENQPKTVGKRVSFDTDEIIVEDRLTRLNRS